MGRFLTLKDMAEAKKLTAIHDAYKKRGEIRDVNKIVQEYHVVCGCGEEGCLFIAYIRKD